MGLIEQLLLNKEAIVNKWFSRVVETYPAETARFLRSQKDPFANPVGQTTLESLRTLVDLLGADAEAKAFREALDPVLRIRAIQDFTPAQATRFVFDLKSIIRESVPADRQTADEMRRIDHMIDEMALAAFDIYMHCREKIFDLKANEMKSRTYKAFARAGLIKEPGDE
ncbi:MAG: hypothetical protein C4519_23650 [Desulfobacteraceae bacterium]|nr:MAG: hypothetical protein C4519_23650 [Desulfobacteraceae bacterium]